MTHNKSSIEEQANQYFANLRLDVLNAKRMGAEVYGHLTKLLDLKPILNRLRSFQLERTQAKPVNDCPNCSRKRFKRPIKRY